MKRYFLNLVRFFSSGVLGYAILVFIEAQLIITEYKNTGRFVGSGWEDQYYFYAIMFTIGAAISLLVIGAILMGILTFFFRKNKESKLPLIFSLVSGVSLGVLLFFLQFGFEHAQY